MSKQTPKAEKANETIKLVGNAVEQAVHTMSEVEKKATDIGAGVLQSLQEINQVGVELLHSSRTKMMERWSQCFSDYLDSCKEALECRTFRDIAALQDKVMQQALDVLLKDSTELREILKDSGEKAVKPSGMDRSRGQQAA